MHFRVGLLGLRRAATFSVFALALDLLKMPRIVLLCGSLAALPPKLNGGGILLSCQSVRATETTALVYQYGHAD